MAVDVGSMVQMPSFDIWYLIVILTIAVGVFLLVMGKKKLQSLIRKFTPFAFKVPVIIFIKRGNATIIQYDKGRVVKREDGTSVYQLHKRNVEIKAPDLDAVTPDGKILLYEFDRNIFVPVKFDQNTKRIETMSNDDQQFQAYEMRRKEQLYKSGMDTGQLMQIAVPILMTVILIIGGIMIYKSMGETLNKASSINQETMQVTKDLSNVQLQTLKFLMGEIDTNPFDNPNNNYNW